MDIGVEIFPTDQVPPPGRVAAEAEARGIESIWFPNTPTSPRAGCRRSRRRPAARALPADPRPVCGDRQRRRRHHVDGSAPASASSPSTTRSSAAKEVASVDPVRRRLLFGIGVGWNVDEMQHHGVDPTRRRALVRETVLAMKALWTKDEASYGTASSSSSTSSWSWPKPVQQPHPPVLYGGAADTTTLRHVVEFCDGWMPIHNRRDILPRLPELYAAAEEAGRDPKTIELGVFGVPPKQGAWRATATPASAGSSSACPKATSRPSSPPSTPLPSWWEGWRDGRAGRRRRLRPRRYWHRRGVRPRGLDVVVREVDAGARPSSASTASRPHSTGRYGPRSSTRPAATPPSAGSASPPTSPSWPTVSSSWRRWSRTRASRPRSSHPRQGVADEARHPGVEHVVRSGDEVGMATDRPEQVIGIHFFNPVPVLRLVELVTSAASPRRDHGPGRSPSLRTCRTSTSSRARTGPASS